MSKQQPFNIVLVHGGFVDGSGWESVYHFLRRGGFNVTVVQNPTDSLADDVEITTNALNAQDHLSLLVGHSYGGAVITQAGNHPNVTGLVYIAAFAPDASESVETLLKKVPPDAPTPPILPPVDGYLFLDRAKFHKAFAADVDPLKAAFMADSQVPWGAAALTDVITTPAWKTKPSWYLVATEDRMIPPPLQRAMANRIGANITEAVGSHAVYVSRPEVVAGMIVRAAESRALAA